MLYSECRISMTCERVREAISWRKKEKKLRCLSFVASFWFHNSHAACEKNQVGVHVVHAYSISNWLEMITEEWF